MFAKVNKQAKEINMRVNSKKTQMLCMTGTRIDEISTYTRDGNDEICSTNGLKILGFNFGPEPNVVAHVSIIVEKFYSKLWVLRFMRRSGMKSTDMRKVYDTVILPGTEYSLVVYHSLTPQYLADKLESVQKMAIKIIYGNGTVEVACNSITDVPATLRIASQLAFNTQKYTQS